VTAPLVLDSSALVALLADAGRAERWVAATTAGAVLAVPELALFEAANIPHRHQLTGALTALEATLAHDDCEHCRCRRGRISPWPSGCGRFART
jgi:predicted nucleic acid-binding protein